jgi:excisionase family DNA binding protein
MSSHLPKPIGSAAGRIPATAPDREFYTRGELAELLRMSERTLRRRIPDGMVRASQHDGGPVLIHRDDAYAAIEKRRRGEI